MNLELLTRGLGAQRRSGLVWGAALIAFALSVVAIWPSMNESGSLESLLAGLPPEVMAALGLEAYGSPVGFLEGNLYAVFLPLLLAVLGIMHTHALTAGDEDAGRLELLLALPVSRVSVYLGRFVSVMVVLAVVSLLVGATVGLTAPAFDLDLQASGLVAVTLSLFLLALFHAALTLALAGIGLRGPVVLALSYAVLALGYVLHALAPLVTSLHDLASVSGWHWALGARPLANGFDPAGTALLAAGAILLVVVGLVAIRRRTIRTP